jgi:Family of unknown function (DUF6496)
MKGDDSETHEGARLSRPAFHGFLPSPLVEIPTTRLKARHVPEAAGQRGRARLVLNRVQPPPAGEKNAKEKPMPQKYGQKASAKVERALHEMKRGELKSGGSGKIVKSRKQAIAIGLSPTPLSISLLSTARGTSNSVAK